MRRFISLTILSLSLAVIPAAAQYGAALYPGYSNETPGMALVDGWVRRYIGRAPSAQDLANGQAIDAGTINPETLLAQILSCDEYYQKRAGSNDRRYIQVLFHDLTGRAPTARQADYWFRRLELSPPGMEGRTDVAYAMLQRYPSALGPAAQPEPDYRPTYFPYRRYGPIYERDHNRR